MPEEEKRASNATLREWFAGQAMVGIIQNEDIGLTSHLDIAQQSVRLADALVEALKR